MLRMSKFYSEFFFYQLMISIIIYKDSIAEFKSVKQTICIPICINTRIENKIMVKRPSFGVSYF